MNSSFKLPKSASLPRSFNEAPNPTPIKQKHQQPQPQPHSQHQNKHQPKKSKMELLQQAKASFTSGSGNGYRQPRPTARPAPEHPRSEHHIPVDYHLRMPLVTDNPKKLSKFLYIRVIPKGEEFAVYLQNNHITFYGKKSSVPSATIYHKTAINRTLFMCTKVKTGFFVITDIIFYKGSTLFTHEERLAALLEIFRNDYLSITATSKEDQPFENITFHLTHLFCQWTDFAKGSLHIPYEIKHLEYCIHTENLTTQTNRFIYILNKKNVKKSTHDTDLVYTSSREFRVDETSNNGLQLEDFKVCVLMNKPFINVLGYSHLDKQEESDEE